MSLQDPFHHLAGNAMPICFRGSTRSDLRSEIMARPRGPIFPGYRGSGRVLLITASFSLSVQLHYDNLVALAENKPELRPLPSYSTVRRFLKAHGLEKWRRVMSRGGR